jgi:transcriptional regulator with PAS, ATPase and Fis domain
VLGRSAGWVAPRALNSYRELVFPARYRPGTSAPMTALYAQMKTLLKGKLPVLINGETGVGKELIAHILHDSSDRNAGPFVAVNCAAIPIDLLEAEMFGIGRGVATGVDARQGKFQMAAGGTLFLDEIGEMSPGLQPKLLRALQEQEIHPLGGRPQAIDVRVIAATNVDLEQHLERGALRQDLFYRLAGFVLEVPPLRRCAEDIPGLIEHFLQIFAMETGTRIRGITVAALRLLTAHPWPGNIRELEHEVRRLVYTSAPDEVIASDRVAGRLQRSRSTTDPVARLIAELHSLELQPTVLTLEEQLIREALRRTQGKKLQACKLLGLSRNGLEKKMKRLAIPARS